MKTKLIATLLVMVLAVTVTMAQQGPRKDRGYNRGGRLDFSERLDLTEDQQTKFDALRVDHFKSTQELRDQVREKQVKLDDLLNNDEIDVKNVEKLVAEIGQVRTKLMRERINHHIEVRKLLTDEQRVKFDMMARHFGHHGFGRHRN